MEKHGMQNIDTSNLRLLSRMDDFKVAKGSPDVRGWDVIGSDGQRLGEVDHLLVDPGARRVRYLGIDLDRGLLAGRTRGGRGGDHVLIPVETARLSQDHRDRVFVPETSADVGALPIYDKSSIQSLLGHERGGREELRPGTEGGSRMTSTSPHRVDEIHVPVIYEEIVVAGRERIDEPLPEERARMRGGERGDERRREPRP